MIGSFIGAGIGAAASIFGGITASKAAKKMRKNLEAQRRLNQNWYDRKYNEDATQRADAQRILTKTQDEFTKRNAAAQGAAAIAGATEESVAATKAANAQALADATSQIAVNGEARKDAIEQTYMQNNRDIDNRLADVERQKVNNIAAATQGVASAAAGLSELDGIAPKKTNV